MMIDVKNLKKHYDTTKAVNDISFHVEKGEILGFLGPNGAGKTTTMKMLTCYLPPTDGSIHVAGHSIEEDSLAIRKSIGYLPESAPLYSEMRVDEYLDFVADMRQIPNKTKRIQEIVEMASLQGVYKKYIDELSKGYKQRVGLAQALIHNPDILILDEPTSGLDPNQIIEIRNLIKELGKEKTIILSTHILQEVSATCTRVLIINEGKIVANDTPDNLQKAFEGEENTIIITTAPEQSLKEKLDSTLVKNVQFLESQEEWNKFQITTTQNSQIQEKMFDVIVQNHWKLKELHKNIVSLEDVFLKLTQKEDKIS